MNRMGGLADVTMPDEQAYGPQPAMPDPRLRLPNTMGGLAAMSEYRMQDVPHEVWGAYDRERAQVARDEALLAKARARPLSANPFAEQPPMIAVTPQGRAQDRRDIANIGEMVVPNDVFDAATFFNPIRRLGAIGKAAPVLGGIAMGADEAQAGARDPRLWSAISKTKLRKPLDEMAHQYTDVRTPVPRFVNPEQLLGGYGVFTPWDLSAANKTLTHVDELKLANPVRLHGGVGFPEANPGQAAASEQSISRRLDNQAAALAETGKPVYIMPMTMSPSGIDASHHVADPLAQLVQTAKITKKDAKAFDDVMRENVPDWVGIKSEGFRDYINNLKGGMTTKALMADRMALAEWQAKGFPDVAAIRHAASEPGLIEMPRNTTGMTISRYIPGQGLLKTTHPSYPVGVAGQHMGQLASLVPFEDMAPDIARELAAYNARNKALGKKVASTPAYHMQKPHEGVPTSQYFDEQWLENIMKRQGSVR